MNTSTDGLLAGRRVAITGTNRGLGRAMAQVFHAQGAALCLHARTEAAVRGVAAALPGDGPAAVTVAGDLDDPTLGARLATAAREGLGGLDVLVLNAAVLGEKAPLATADLALFSQVMRLNVDAQARLCAAALPLLSASKGTVVWLTSALGRIAVPRYGAYCASKHAIEGLSKLVAVEHAADGVISVAVAPGMVRTEMLKAALEVDDVSAHTAPEHAALGFARMLAGLGAEDSGTSVDIDRWLPSA